MSDQSKTKAELLSELAELRQEVARLKAAEAECVELKRSQVGPKPESAPAQTFESDQMVQDNDLLQALLDNVPDWIFFKDAQSRIIRSNRTHSQVLGLKDPRQAIGKTDFDFFPPEDAQRFFEEEQNFLKTGRPLIGRVGPTPGPDGEILWRSETKVPLKDDAGQVVGLVGISRDVTEFKRVEAALRQSEERYRALFEDSPISLWEEDLGVIKVYIDELRQAGITDFRTYFDQHPEMVRHYANQTQVTAVNPATLSLYQAADQEAFFNGFETIFREESLATFKEEMIAIAAGQTRFEGESVHYTLTGCKIYVTLTWSVVPGHEQTYGKVAVSLIDITAYKETQARLARQAADLETVAHVSTAMATILETDKLLQEVVDLTKERFGLYHAHLYLLNELGDELKLVAGAGEVGRQMVAEGWSIPIDQERSLVARAARDGQGVIVNDVRAVSDYLPNPLLPDTRSEMAVPLLIGGLVSGVLDVQAVEVNRFSEEDSRIKTILAAQIAVALENADQHARTRLALAEMEQSQEILRSIIDATPDWIFIKDREHRYRLANQGYANALHIEPDHFIGKNDLELGFPEELVKGNPEKGIRGFWADDRLVLDSGETQVYPSDPATIDGQVHIFHTIKAPLRDASGDIWGVLAFARDVTDLQTVETALAKRAAELETVAQVGTAATTILETDKLLQTVADLTKERFGLYHVHIYLLNDPSPAPPLQGGGEGGVLVLAAGAGEVGRQMVAEGWGISLQREKSLVAQAARERRGVIANHVQEEPDWLPNPLLPDTRSELAVPLIVGNQLLGVLDVQADAIDRFTEEDVRIQTTLAGQIGVALQNARSYEQTRQARFQLQQRVESLNCLNELGREIEENPALPELLQWTTERIPPVMRYPQLCRVAIEYDDQLYGQAEAIDLPTQMAHGLYVGGELLGRIHIAYTEKQDFLDEESALLGGIATRLSSYIENQRLLAQVQERATELEETTTFLDSILENIPTMLFVKDAEDLRFVRWNKAGEDLVGYKREDLFGKNDYDFFPEEEADFFTAKDREVLAGGKLVDIPEEPIATLHQGTRTLHTRKIPIYGPDGEPKYLLGISEDITERKQTEEALRRSEERFTLAVQGSNDGIWDWDIAKGTLYWSPRAKESLGYADDEFEPNMEVLEALVHPDDKAKMEAALEAHLKERALYDVVQRLRHKSGEYRWFRERGQAIWDEQGNPTRMAGSTSDITEQMAVAVERERLLVEVQRLAAIVENAPDFIGISSLAGEALYINPAGLAMVGLPADLDLTTMDFAQFIPPAELEQFMNEGLTTAFEKGSWTVEGNLLRADGATLAVEKTVAVNYDANHQPVSLGITMRDIAERKQAELEREKLLAEVEAAYRQYFQQEWTQFLAEQHGGHWRIELHQAGLADEQGSNGTKGQAKIQTPISLRGQQLGSLSLEDADPNRRWTAEERALVEAVSEQLAQTVENLRLFDETRQRATREQLTRQITDKMRSAPDVDSIIETGLSELAKALGASRSYVKLTPKLEQAAAKIEASREQLNPNGTSAAVAHLPGETDDQAEQLEEN